jgi:hypothetical protein
MEGEDTEFADVVVTDADLAAAIAASPTKQTEDESYMETAANDNSMSAVVETASRMPSGHPQQAVDELGQRITSLADALKIAQAKERSQRRQEVASQLKSTTRQIDLVYKQNFKIGDRVLIKHKSRGNPSCPATVTCKCKTGFTVKLSGPKLPSGQCIGNSLKVCNSRSRRGKYAGRYLNIWNAKRMSRKGALPQERKRLGEAYTCLQEGNIPNDKRSKFEMDNRVKKKKKASLEEQLQEVGVMEGPYRSAPTGRPRVSNAVDRTVATAAAGNGTTVAGHANKRRRRKRGSGRARARRRKKDLPYLTDVSASSSDDSDANSDSDSEDDGVPPASCSAAHASTAVEGDTAVVDDAVDGTETTTTTADGTEATTTTVDGTEATTTTVDGTAATATTGVRTTARTQSSNKHGLRQAPKCVLEEFQNLKRKGGPLHKSNLPCRQSTFHVTHNVYDKYHPNKVATFSIHIVDPQALGASHTPCPVHGFCGDRVTPEGWMKKPRVAHGIAGTEYFVGRQYKCARCVVERTVHGKFNSDGTKKTVTFTSCDSRVHAQGMTSPHWSRFVLNCPVVVYPTCAWTRSAHDLAKTLLCGTSCSVSRVCKVFKELHSLTHWRRTTTAMLHEETAHSNSLNLGIDPGPRRIFNQGDIGLVPPAELTFFRTQLMQSLSKCEEYEFLWREQYIRAAYLALDYSRKGGKGLHVMRVSQDWVSG